jgi:hypothetical protein
MTKLTEDKLEFARTLAIPATETNKDDVCPFEIAHSTINAILAFSLRREVMSLQYIRLTVKDPKLLQIFSWEFDKRFPEKKSDFYNYFTKFAR